MARKLDSFDELLRTGEVRDQSDQRYRRARHGERDLSPLVRMSLLIPWATKETEQHER